ncbi:MAG: hypothetical protein P8X60_04250 [Robiginitalea sp.]|jgi:hypothetical protein
MKVFCYFIIFLFLGSIVSVNAQTVPLQEGQVMKLILPADGDFNHVLVPRKNFIIKRGGVASMKSLDGNLVVISEIRESSKGTKVVLKRKDGSNFFRSFPTITANWPEATESRELIPPN